MRDDQKTTVSHPAIGILRKFYPATLVMVLNWALTGYALWCGAYGIAAGIFIIGFTCFYIVFKRLEATGLLEFEKSDYGVPHCKFQRTPDGFSLRFKNRPFGLFGTRITVTKDAVIIDYKKLKRADFGAFFVDGGAITMSSSKLVVLGYTYGRRSFEFGGAWKEQEAGEVASALNDYLRRIADGEEVTAEKLRDSHSTDF